MRDTSWTIIRDNPPEEGRVVQTMIRDEKGERNQRPLVLKNRLWWHPDMSMYVYYTPTHWKP